jgi:gliding motility-associated-like protein
MPRKTFLTILCCLWISCITHLATAQVQCVPTFVTEHATATPSEIKDIKMLPDGTAIITGRATVGADYNGFAMRVTATGSTMWTYTWGGAGNDELTNILLLDNGNILLYGYTTINAISGKPWLVCIDINGNLLWNRELIDNTAGSSRDRLKAIKQFTDGDLVGTFNVNDSTANSDPVIFKIGTNGAVRWMTRFDNGGAESFTSLAFAGTTIYAAGFSTTTVRQGVIVQLNSADGALLTSKNIYHYGTSITGMQEEISGLEVYNNTISFGLLALKGDPTTGFGTNQLFITQTDMQGNTRMVSDAGNIGGTIKMQLRRTADEGFVILHESTGTFAPFFVKYNKFGKVDWTRALNEYYYQQYNRGFDLTPDGGVITAGYYNIMYPVPATRMQIARLNAYGEGGACLPRTIQRLNDTATLKEQPFAWASVSTVTGASPSLIMVAQMYTTTETKLCETTTCVDKTPLPPDCNKTYRIEYGGYRRTIFRDAVTTPDGGRIITGDLGDDGIIVKIGANGDIIWSKKAFDVFYSSITPMRLLRMPDNTYLIFARTAKAINHGAWTYITMFRMDENGNTLSSHDIEINGSYMSGEIVDVTQTPDGGFVLLGVDGWGGGGTDCFAIRFDPALNVVWKKQLEHNPLTPVMKSIASSRTAVYIAFDAYDSYNKFTFGLSKLDLATGNMIWGRRFQTNDQDNTERVNRVVAINDTAYVFVNHYMPTSMFTGTRTVLMARVDPQGNLTKAVELNAGNFNQFNTAEHLDASPPSVTHTTDNDFVLAQYLTTTGGTQELNLTRLTTDANVIWSAGHPAMSGYSPFNIHQQANGFMIVGAALAPRDNASYFANGFMLKVDSVGQIVYPNAGYCSTVQENMMVNPVVVTPVPYGSDQTSELTSVILTTGAIKIMDEFMDATLHCYDPASCSQVTLAQRGNGCAVTDTLVYFLENAGSCGAVATWQYDPLFFKPEYISSDTLKLIPLQQGASTVKVDMEGHCFQETKTIQAAVLLSAANMHLAPDTVICEGGSIRISAGRGYASYRWNNNTIDSFLIVNAPGKYYVDVTDNCGGTGTDTIVVTRAGATFSVATPAATKCNNDPIQLQAIGGFINYEWNTQNGYQAQGLSVEVNPAVTTKYYVEAEKWPGCKVRDSIMVNVLSSPAITLPPDATICRGDSVLLDAGPSFTTYNWNTGGTTQQLKAKTAGKYKVEATWSNGCHSKDSFELRFHNDPVVSLDKNPILCKDASRTLSPGAYNAYAWSDGSTGATLTVNGTGTWWITITDQNGCKASDTTTINTIAPLPANFMGQQTEICQYGELKLVPAVSFNEYHWSDRSTGASLTINKPGEYWLQATDHNNCTGADTIKVIQKECLIGLYIPNAFTPNGDRNNDMFTPMLDGNAEYIRFSVYNRYGQIVFETTTMKQGWDGKIKGVAAVAGTYVWQCRYKLAGQPEKLEKGIVQLIR